MPDKKTRAYKFKGVITTIYLDNCATTKITNPVLEAMLPFITENYGNASSLYSLGRKSRQAIEHAREQVAKAINAEPSQIFFTSGATEGNNWVISNFNHVLCSRVEHPSVLRNPKCFKMDYTSLAHQIYEHMPDLVTNMFVNNEVGAIYNIKQMAEISHKMKVPFHTDAVQAYSHLPIDVKELDVDSLTLSGHKFHAPKGAGILYLKEPDKYEPLLYGGHQEKNLRAGTENVASIVGLGKACELYNYSESRELYIQELKNHLSDFIQENIPDSRINYVGMSVSNILNVSFKGIEGESLALMLDRNNICVSSGSACNSGSLEPSYVLKDLKVPDEYVYGTIRFSFSEFNTLDEIIVTEQVLKETIEKLRN